MSGNDSIADKEKQSEGNIPDEVAIEGDLPLTAIDIESQKAMIGGRNHPIRGFSKWFAARPTPAVRLAILGSVYPKERIDSDKLLDLMQIGPKQVDEGIEDHVIKKYTTENKRSNSLDDHYGYSNPVTQDISKKDRNQIKEDVGEHWGEDVPTIIDPTSGRGTIPFETMRYGLPSVSNDIDPIPAIINKIALELAPDVGSVKQHYNDYAQKIIDRTQTKISQYFKTKSEGRQIMGYATSYLISCDSCGGDVPLVSKWGLKTNNNHAVMPIYQDGNVNYEYVNLDNIDNFDKSNAPLSGRGGDAECPHCAVAISSERIREKFQNDQFQYTIYGTNYEKANGESTYRAGDDIDLEGLREAAERVETDFNLMDFFSQSIAPGYNRDQIRGYGLTEWRDVFTPRQLVAHYELFNIFNQIKVEISDSHEDKESKLLIALLAQAVDRQIQYNNRLAGWRSDRGSPTPVFASQNYNIKRMFAGNNIVAKRMGLDRHFSHVINNYERLSSMVSATDTEKSKPEVYNRDATTILNQLKRNDIQVAVIDPPYFEQIMYGEMSDFMYLTQSELLDDVFPEIMRNKNDDRQMVVNSSRYDKPREHYESMMRDMFNEMKGALVENGILTLMFTDRETKAWNTILKALIQSNFTITAAHPVKTESSDKVGMRNKARVESSIIVTARNTPNKTEMTTWSDVQENIKRIAGKETKRLLSVENINKIDASIEAFGAALKAYSDAYPVEDKYGETVYPGQVLTTVRNEVYRIIANDDIETSTDQLDGVTRWYILSNVLYGDRDIPYDEANQLGIGADIDINEIKRPTKIWSKSSGDVSLNNHTDRVQGIIKLRDSNAENPSTQKYPVDPTADSFTYTIDAIHAVLHVYEKEGQKPTRDWLAQRELKSNQQFKKAVKALLEATPENSQMRETLQDLVAGETGDYLDISVRDLNIGDTGGDRQSGIGEYE